MTKRKLFWTCVALPLATFALAELMAFGAPVSSDTVAHKTPAQIARTLDSLIRRDSFTRAWTDSVRIRQQRQQAPDRVFLKITTERAVGVFTPTWESVRAVPAKDTVVAYVTVAQCTEAIIANVTLFYESGMDSATRARFRHEYPKEDSLAQLLHRRFP